MDTQSVIIIKEPEGYDESYIDEMECWWVRCSHCGNGIMVFSNYCYQCGSKVVLLDESNNVLTYAQAKLILQGKGK